MILLPYHFAYTSKQLSCQLYLCLYIYISVHLNEKKEQENNKKNKETKKKRRKEVTIKIYITSTFPYKQYYTLLFSALTLCHSSKHKFSHISCQKKRRHQPIFQ